MKALLSLALAIFLLTDARAQMWKNTSVDDVFALARTEAFEGKYDSSREKLRFILEQQPQYDEVRVFLARTYAWTASYDESRRQLELVLKARPENSDAMYALIDVELWSHHEETALSLIEQAVSTNSEDPELLYRQASAFSALRRYDEALVSLHALLAVNPKHAEGLKLREALMLKNLRYTAGLQYAVDAFSRRFDPAHFLSFQAGSDNRWGASLVRVNGSRRFGTQGLQIETDLYPRITRGAYAYVNYGYSPSSIFPEHRAGAEVYVKAGKRLETSAGMRYLSFPAEKVIMFTGSVSLYSGNYWFSLRPYMTSGETDNLNTSGAFFIRRYMRDQESYIGLTAAAGFSPDYARIQGAFPENSGKIYLLESMRAGVVVQKAFAGKWTVNAMIEAGRQSTGADDGSLGVYSGLVGLKRKF